MTPEDLRAAVQAGIVSEAQAASLKALSEAREGYRLARPSEDEPFEFFKGFSEIFISIGLVILLSGVLALITWFGGLLASVLLPVFAAIIVWWWAQYFTLKRRMNLPSMVLAATFGISILIAGFTTFVLSASDPSRLLLFLPSAAAAIGMLVWYRRFHLPFAMFLLGIFALGALYALTASAESMLRFVTSADSGNAFAGFFDLRESPAFALTTLLFGVAAFVAGLWFDMRDPHRLGRHAATAFWLHLLAAPALVNTVALTLYNSGGTQGMLLLIVALVVITLLALVVDRRSFLSAAIAYVATVIAWAIGGGDFGSWTLTLLLLGGFVTAVGTWWVQLRAFVMRALPDFPGKDRLPPYSLPE